MESTGSYWKPVFNLLESRFEVVLVNAHHIKQVPGRKFRRIAGRRGKKRAAIAVAHTLLVIIDHFLKENTTYHELTDDTAAA